MLTRLLAYKFYKLAEFLSSLTRIFGLVCRNRSWILVSERYDGLSYLEGVPVFLFGVTDALWCDRTISATNNQDIVITVINYPFDLSPLSFFGRREELHSGWNTIKLQKSVH